jgi:cephalosporin hydroxylase
VATEEWPYFAQPLTDIGSVLRRMHARVSTATTYWGIPTMKNPTDAWIYEELIWKLRPDVIVEVGNYKGGHLLKMAHQLDIIGAGEIVGVDIEQVGAEEVVAHERITLVTGEASACYPTVRQLVAGRNALVIDDSDHGYTNTLAVLRKYSDLVKPDGYMVIEDTIGIEAQQAVQEFLAENRQFKVDLDLEGFGVSWNPNGYLRRK